MKSEQLGGIHFAQTQSVRDIQTFHISNFARRRARMSHFQVEREKLAFVHEFSQLMYAVKFLVVISSLRLVKFGKFGKPSEVVVSRFILRI